MIYQTQNITNKQFWFFLLINTKSGGGWGKQYLTSKKKQFYFQYKQTTKVHVSLHDLLDKQSKQQALTKIKQLTQAQNQQIRVVICGGDGTMIWGVEETLFAGVDLNKIVFCCIPIGTGNDFSRTLGWGSSPIKFQDSNIFQLKKRIIQWLHAKIHYFDLWQIQIETYDNGDIICVKNKSQVSIQKRTFLRPFCNYVGIGIDARVSYSFQKHRKNTKLGNLIMYGCLGCCKLFKKIQTIQNSFQQFVQKNQNSIKEKLLQKLQPELKNETKEGQKQQQIQAGIKQAQEININVKKGYRGLICLNSTSYMAGRMNAWNTSKIGSKQQNKKFKTQQIDDGIIQFIGYKDQLRLGLQTLIHSGAKIAQGEGPFHIRLKKQLQIMETFIQIDGQGLKIRNLKSILIKKYEKIQNSKIRVLIKQKNK